MSSLPKRQREIVEFIRSRVHEETAPPTLQEIGDHFGIGISTVQEHIAALEAKGIIEKTKSRSRGMRLADDEGITPRSVPILGWTTAGQPALALEQHEGHLTVDGSLVRGENVFALRVKGDSMIEAGIMDGDMVIIRQQEDVDNNEIALVLIENEEATIKRFIRKGRKVVLKPANQTMNPMEYDAAQVRIQGKIVASFRTF